jgi:hypothetical protein
MKNVGSGESIGDVSVPGWRRFQDSARAFEIRRRGGVGRGQILGIGNLLPILEDSHSFGDLDL